MLFVFLAVLQETQVLRGGEKLSGKVWVKLLCPPSIDC